MIPHSRHGDQGWHYSSKFWGTTHLAKWQPDSSQWLRNILTAVSRELAFQNRVKTERPPTTNMIRELELCYPDDSSDSDEQVEAHDNSEVTARMVNATEVYLVFIQASWWKESRKEWRNPGLMACTPSTHQVAQGRKTEIAPDTVTTTEIKIVAPCTFYTATVWTQASSEATSSISIFSKVFCPHPYVPKYACWQIKMHRSPFHMTRQLCHSIQMITTR